MFKTKNEEFVDLFSKVEPIKLKEPLAQTLGAFKNGHSKIEYTFADVVKMAGHACPTVAGAYICCKKALQHLYRTEIPVRGEIAIKIYGNADEGTYGVIGQVFSYITGAAPSTGFKGLGYKFKRRDLLIYNEEKHLANEMCFEFKRIDNNKTVLVKFFPSLIPSPAKNKLGELMEKVIWESASREEVKEFQRLWIEKIKNMLIEDKGINDWLKIEEGEKYAHN